MARSSRSPPAPAVLVLIAAAGVAAAGLTVVLAASAEELAQPVLRTLLIEWSAVPFIAGGLIAWRRRPDSAFGRLMILAGFASMLTTLQWTDLPVLHTVGRLADLLVVALWLHVFLAYPSGRLRRRPERLLVTTGYLVAVGLQVVVLMLGDFGTEHLVTMTQNAALAETVQNVQLLGLSGLSLAGVALLVVRRRQGGRARRRVIALLVDSFGLALVMVAALLVSGTFALPGFEQLQLALFGVVGLAPVAFLIGLLDARLARGGIADLLIEMGSQPAPDLQDPIARVLRDPSLTVAYWLPQYGSWADQDGEPVTLPELDDATGAADVGAGGDRLGNRNGAPSGDEDGALGDRRVVTLIERDGEPTAALIHHPSLRDEPELIEAVTAAAGIALENGRLQAELKARLQDLHSSRGRVIDAAQKERRELERNLHDGAQQRLVALALDLGLLGDRLAADPDSRAHVERARQEVSASLDELRDLARGIHPAVVSGHGLPVALESLAARMNLPLSMTIQPIGRLAEPVEVAAYYVVCESLTNVGKHARATSTRISLEILDDVLMVEVADDGVGGADTERGSGLRGLADRVEALDGRLRVWTPLGGGTRVRAEIPCG
jgi:signal transduction histidine kinase